MNGTFGKTTESSIPRYLTGDGGYSYPPQVNVNTQGLSNSCLVTSSESSVFYLSMYGNNIQNIRSISVPKCRWVAATHTQ